MNRKLAFLSGLAVLAVVLAHAIRWGLVALFGWQGQLSSVISPDPGQASGLSYYSLQGIQQLCYFAVPAFLFISGFFIAYAARGSSATLSWKVIRTRIINLLWPYLIWSAVILVAEGVSGKTLPLGEYLAQLVNGKTYFVPMLFQFYLLSPFICRLGKSHPVALLSIAAGFQLVGLIYVYGELGGLPLPGSPYDYLSLFVFYALYFPLGVVAGLRPQSFQTIIARYRRWLAASTVVFGVASILEGEWLYHTTGDFWLANGMTKLSTVLYAVAFILTLLAFDWKLNRLSKDVSWIGQRSLGIYLASSALLSIFAHVIGRFIPQLLSQQLFLAGVLVVTTVGAVLLVMTGVARSPLRLAYHYLFG